jgi:predicted PilT family ATPase
MSAAEFEPVVDKIMNDSTVFESIDVANAEVDATEVETTEVNATEVDITEVTSPAEVDESVEPEPVGAPPSISDEDAFPALGSGASTISSQPVSWGPSMRSVVSTPVTSASSNGSALKKGAARSKNIQDRFHIPSAASLNLVKAEFVKIITDLKRKYSLSIDSTLSGKTKDRSFVINGLPDDVSAARKELVRRLTKPVKISFKVPATTRSAIIGASGRNLKPIIDSTGAKIEIERNQTPIADVDADETITVTIEGDVDGAQEAQRLIMAIVHEETKNLTVRINAPENLLPFIKQFDISCETLTVTGPNKNGLIIISGLRDEVLNKKIDITRDFETLAVKIKTEVKTIPKRFHQFINTDDLLAQHEVVVEIPTDDADEQVKFIGLPKNVEAAIQTARNASSQFAIDSLLISKAHGGNVVHARNVAVFLTHSGILKAIGRENKTNVRGPSYDKLASKELAAVTIETTAPTSETTAIQASRKAVIEKVNRFSPSRFLVISDISSFFAKKIASTIEVASKTNNVHVVPLSDLSGGATDDIILVALDGQDDEFAPTQDEIDLRLQATSAALDELRKAQAELKKVILDVPSEKQQFIEGPNGTTLSSLISSVGSIDIRLHNDSESEADDKVFIQGSRADVSKIEKEIESLLKDAADQKDLYSFVQETTVPTSILPRLIGKSGANLKEISDKFAVHIDVDKDSTGEKTGLKITGYKFNVKEADHHISNAAKRWVDETTKILNVAKNYRAAMIGSNGQNVKKLQIKYNVTIHFQKSSDDVIIKGPSRGVTKATEELQDLLDFEIANGYVKELRVPEAAIARIIGRSGETVDRIALHTGIDIRVQSEGEGEGEGESETRNITLTGSRKGLTEAEKQIMAIVKEIEDTVTIELEVNPKYFKDILGPKGATKEKILSKALGNSDGISRKLLQIPEAGSDSNKISSTGPKKVVEKIIDQVKELVAEKESSVTESIEVPKEKHRLLIGPGGSTRRGLEEAFNVIVNVPRSNEKSSVVTINGQPENVEKAKAKVNELTADSWKTVVDVPAYVHAAVFQRGLFTRKLRIEHNVEVTFGDSNRRAQNLSNKAPAIPKDARGSEEENFKFITVDDEVSKDENDTIPWRLAGDDNEVAEAEKLIQEAIKRHCDDDTLGFLWVKDPVNTFPKIIGSQGARLNNIRKKSGAQITVPKPTDKVNDIIFVKGQRTAVEKAEKLLSAEIKP